MTKENQNHEMLKKIMENLPENFQTTCKTAQLKSVQHNAFDTPKECWCCWVTDANGKKFFAMYHISSDEVKVIPEQKRNSYIVKQIK